MSESQSTAHKPSPEAAVTQYGGWIKRTALHVAATMPWANIDDLIQWGMVGLLEALDRFDSSRGRPFEAFAYQRIRGAMIDSLRREGTQVRISHAEQLRTEVIGNEALPNYGANPSVLTTQADDLARVSKAVAQLSQRQQLILYLFYTKGHNNREIAQALGVSDASISQTRSRGIQRVRSLLGLEEHKSGESS